MLFFLLACFATVLATLPVVMFVANLKLFQPATNEEAWLEQANRERVSVLIPARNEEAAIDAALTSFRHCLGPSVEIIVLDDQSDDRTGSIVAEVCGVDSRVRLLSGRILPEGWNGKQHACWKLANEATGTMLLFVDADVRVSPDAVQRMVAQLLKSEVSLLSGFPHQETGTWSEKLLIPLMHFVLLGYLPIHRMRTTTDPSLSAGCGQLMLAKRDDYFLVDGHRSIRDSRHDGLKLPRAFRLHHLATDIFDATNLARCRMYRNRAEVVRGLLKNATEGIAHPKLIGIFSLLMLGAGVLPITLLLVAVCCAGVWPITRIILFIATIASFLPRFLAAIRFRQSWLGVMGHPAAVAWFIALQWLALVQWLRGKRVTWRGRC